MFISSDKGGNPYRLNFLNAGQWFDLKKKRVISLGD
jgi:hypothetical protein